MLVNGCDCSIVIKTSHVEKDIPYSDETLREAVSFLQEEASIEGDGICQGLRKISGITGCVVTPLTIGTAPLLLYLAMGGAGNPVFISETRNLYQYRLNLTPMEDSERFDLIQDRGTSNNEQLTINNERKIYENCRVQGFELRIMRDEAIKLKLEICGECAPRTYPYTDRFERTQGEWFSGECTTYRINGKEYTNIYGITLVSKKQGGTKTEVWIKRTLSQSSDIPEVIEELTVTAQLLRNQYEFRHYGTFRITLKRLVLISDETEINTADTVIGPIRYYVAGSVYTEVFSSSSEAIS
jgi:DNA-binding Lrp family transcriptional regulator